MLPTNGPGRRRSGKHEPFEPELVDVAPTPFFAGLDRASERMLRRPKMPDRVLVLGRVAASDVTALHAHPKLQPDVAKPHAVQAIRPAPLHVANAIDVPRLKVKLARRRSTSARSFGRDPGLDLLASRGSRFRSCIPKICIQRARANPPRVIFEPLHHQGENSWAKSSTRSKAR
jgi:hypothetical protein